MTSNHVYIFHDITYGLLFAYGTLEGAQAAGIRIRSDAGKWLERWPEKWTRGDYQEIILRPII